MGQITVYSGPERRRRWSDEQRRQIVSEAFRPGSCVSRVARQYDVSTGLVYTWRRKQMQQGEALEFAEAVVDDAGGPVHGRAAIIVELERGKRVQIFSGAPPALAAAALKALR